jgi:hypothetical protein
MQWPVLGITLPTQCEKEPNLKGGEHERKNKKRRWFICMSDIGLFFEPIFFSS